MTIPKRNSLFALNIVFPLLCGAFIYLTKAEPTYLSDYLHAFRKVFPTISYPYIIGNFACDFLWSYSLFFCLRLTLGDQLKGKHNTVVIIVSAVAAVILETVQLFKSVPGTFDPFDLVTELVAIAFALLITTIIERRFKHYEKKSVN